MNSEQSPLNKNDITKVAASKSKGMLDTPPESPLLNLYKEIVNELEINDEKSNPEIGVESLNQIKFALSDTEAVKQKLSLLEGVNIIGPTEQTNYYIFPDQKPSVTSEVLYLKSEKDLRETLDDQNSKFTLVYKTQAQEIENSSTIRSSKSIPLSEEQSIATLMLIDNKEIKLPEIRKIRTQYHYKGLIFNIDEGVQFIDDAGGDQKANNSKILGHGNFLEIIDVSQEITKSEMENIINEITEHLYDQIPFREPYINSNFFDKFLNSASKSSSETNQEPEIKDCDFVGFDGKNISKKIDWKNILKHVNDISCNNEKSIEILQQGLIKKLRPWIEEIKQKKDITKINDTGSIVFADDLDALKYESEELLDQLKVRRTFRIKGPIPGTVLKDNTRVYGVLALTNDDKIVFFICMIWRKTENKNTSNKDDDRKNTEATFMHSLKK